MTSLDYNSILTKAHNKLQDTRFVQRLVTRVLLSRISIILTIALVTTLSVFLWKKISAQQSFVEQLSLSWADYWVRLPFDWICGVLLCGLLCYCLLRAFSYILQPFIVLGAILLGILYSGLFTQLDTFLESTPWRKEQEMIVVANILRKNQFYGIVSAKEITNTTQKITIKHNRYVQTIDFPLSARIEKNTLLYVEYTNTDNQQQATLWKEL